MKKRGIALFLTLALFCALALPAHAAEPWRALEDITYYGDKSKCAMTEEQAKAFEAVIVQEMARTDWGSEERNRRFRESSGKVEGYAALFDLGNGIPALFFARASYPAEGDDYLERGEASIWTYQEGEEKAALLAKDKDLLCLYEKAIAVNIEGEDSRQNVYFYGDGKINTDKVSTLVSDWYDNIGEDPKPLPDHYIDGKGATDAEREEWSDKNMGKCLASAVSGAPFSADYSVYDLSPIGTVRAALNTYVTAAQSSTRVILHLNGGAGGSALWTNDSGTLTVPTNPTRAGYTFGGWYTDAGFVNAWNFNDTATPGLSLYAKWVPVSSTATTAGRSTHAITLNGTVVNGVEGYTLIAPNGGDVTYVKLRDVAALLDGTAAQFNVDWKNGSIYITTGAPYTTRNGTELRPVTGTDGSYAWNVAPILFDGVTKTLEGIVLENKEGQHTFFKLRDLGAALGFNVNWSAEKGISIETN